VDSSGNVYVADTSNYASRSSLLPANFGKMEVLALAMVS